jgi:hypothetical protein
MIRWSYVEVNVTTLLTASRESVDGELAAKAAGYSMAPVAMMAPCPGIRRGTEAVVPRVPGFVSEIVVPSKSETWSLPVRARDDVVGGPDEYEALWRPDVGTTGDPGQSPSPRPRRGRADSPSARVQARRQASKASFAGRA